MRTKTALIFGATGQDGSYLSEYLLDEGYEVHGVARRCSIDNTENLSECKKNYNFYLREGDITDSGSVNKLISEGFTECYNLSAQSHVHTSFEQPHLTFQINTLGVLNILNAIKEYAPDTRFYQASSSEMFGNSYTEAEIYVKGTMRYTSELKERIKFQDENTPFSPNSPYAISKVAAHHLVQNYRESYGLHLSCSISFNHESARRGENFVTRKITKYVAGLVNHLDNCHDGLDPDFIVNYGKLQLGNLDARRDWGYSPNYCEAYYLMLQQDEPDDYVVATGKTYSIIDFLKYAFGHFDLRWKDYVEVNDKFMRPSEVHYLLGNADKIKNKLGWKPTVDLQNLVRIMLESDLHKIKNGPTKLQKSKI